MRTTMWKPKRVLEKTCLYCGKPFMTFRKGKSTARYCSASCASKGISPEARQKHNDAIRKPPVIKNCLECGKVMVLQPSGKKSAKRKFCSPSCAARYQFRDPKFRYETTARMRAKSKGTFLSRGGNGQLTAHQKKLCEALGLPDSAMEYVILTTKARGYFQSLPNSYKVDLGIPEVRLAIEVDGKTHKDKKWKFLDRRKTAVLNFIGWTVLRFWNEEVDRDLENCVRTVMSTISKLKETTTTSPTES